MWSASLAAERLRASLSCIETSPQLQGWPCIWLVDGHLARSAMTTLRPKGPAGSYLHIIVANVLPSVGSSLWRFGARLRRLSCTGEGEFEILWIVHVGVQPFLELRISVTRD